MKKKVLLVLFVFLPLLAYAQHEHMMDMPLMGDGVMAWDDNEMLMPGFYGNYPSSREASGTSWQPESSPIEGKHFMYRGWNIMYHGYAFGIYDYHGGKRGSDKIFSSSMLMFMAQKELADGAIGYRSMYSLDPLMGKRGYPLIFQNGETYDGMHPLIDRQHPHDFFMEEALTYSLLLSEQSFVFGYLGLPGEPALGPPAFMHRFSGVDNPEAPLSHHWLDSTHITFGVATLGYILGKFKFETSAFRGREPDENRWDIESPGFDSYSGRATFNPGADLSFQASYGDIDSPEGLEPDVDVKRITVSAMYNRDFKKVNWQTTVAWGRNNKDPGFDTDAYLIESALKFMKSHTLFGRFEYLEKDELFDGDDLLSGKIHDVQKITLGYVYDLPRLNGFDLGVGGSFSEHFISDTLEEAYSNTPRSFMLFLRVKL